MFKGGTRDYIIINKQGCASWSSKKRGHHFVFAKSLLKEAIKFLLQNCFFSIGNITMIQVIGIPMGTFSNLGLVSELNLIVTKDTSCQTDFQIEISRPRYNEANHLISALNKHLKILEKQLDEKQIIIETLLQNIHNCSFSTSLLRIPFDLLMTCYH